MLAIGDAVVVSRGYAVCLMHRVTRFCCRCAPDRGQATLLQGICGVARICVERKTCGSVACPAIGDAVVVNRGHAVCLMYRVIRFCCRCAPDRGQATLLQGICGVARIVSTGKSCGERGLSRDRRRSRRKPGLRALPDTPRHPMLLPLRARSRASHAPTKDLWRCQNLCRTAKPVGAWLVPRSATQSS